MSREPLSIFIGYDEREDDAYQVCRASMTQHASEPLHIVKLDQAALRRAGWYRREWRQEGRNRVDQGDLKPFSTDFAFTRFFVPALSLYQGWSLFCDCDFLFTADIAEVFAHANSRYAVMCVKHAHDPVELTKMGGLAQGAYRRKNWSSFCLFNNAHPANAMLTGYLVNHFAGAYLHAFTWLHDDEIGALPHEWNWLAGVDKPLPKKPSGIHFTLGVASIPGCENTPYASMWRSIKSSLEARSEAA